MKRYALCFSGYFGKQKESIYLIDKNSRYYDPGCMKNATSEQLNPICSIRHFQQYIINCNSNVDVFFHCWNTDTESQELLLNEYNPVSYLFEDQTQPHFKYTYDYKNSMNIPRFYSEEQSIQLVRDYEQNHNIRYQMVFHTIFDYLLFTPINLGQLNKSYIYTSYWNETNPTIIQNNIHFETKNGLYDQWLSLIHI